LTEVGHHGDRSVKLLSYPSNESQVLLNTILGTTFDLTMSRDDFPELRIRKVKANSQRQHRRSHEAGFSFIELTMVAALMGIMTAIAVPQLAGQRRLVRANAVARDMMTQLRYARQLAMAQRQSFTFQYNNTTKQIIIIDNNASGNAVLTDTNYPNNAGSTIVSTTSLTGGGLDSTEINYGIPTGLPTTALGDGVSLTNLTSGKINITFQPDGTVVDANGTPVDRALYTYNTKIPKETAAALSIIGSAGRIKLWRYYQPSNTYVE
jgi:type II secretion system protein H